MYLFKIQNIYSPMSNLACQSGCDVKDDPLKVFAESLYDAHCKFSLHIAHCSLQIAHFQCTLYIVHCTSLKKLLVFGHFSPVTLRRKWHNKCAGWALFWYPYFEQFSSLQTFEIPKKNTQPLISIRGLAFNVLLRSSEKWKFQDTALESVWDKHSSE